MGAWSSLWLSTKSLTKYFIVGTLIGQTINDRYVSITRVKGISMYPTLAPSDSGFAGSLKGDYLLVERFCLERYKFSRGDIIIFKSPLEHRELFVKRLIALPGDWIQVPNSSETLHIPEGHCWVEGDNASCSLDSRHFGPIPLGLITGRTTHVIWPPQRISQVERKPAADRIFPY